MSAFLLLTVWSPALVGMIKRVESVQRAFTSEITSHEGFNVEEMFVRTGIKTFKGRLNHVFHNFKRIQQYY